MLWNNPLYILAKFQPNRTSHFWEKVKKLPFSALFGTLWMNQKRFRHAVFWKWSEIIPSTFWPSFSQIVRAIFEKKSKNCHFDHIFVLYGWTGFFFKNPAVWHFLYHRYLSAYQVSRKSLGPFSQTNADTRAGTVKHTDGHFDSYYLHWRGELLISQVLEKD